MTIKKLLKSFVLIVGLLTMSLNFANVAYAEIIEQTVEATGEYRIGDNDTRAQAKDLALSDAKRIAAEKVLVYVESNSIIENFAAVKDRIETYTKAKMQILDQQFKFVGEESTVCQANIVANVRIDMDEIKEQQRIEEQRRQEEERKIYEEEQRQKEEQQKMDDRRRHEEDERRERDSNRKTDDFVQAILNKVLDSIKL